MAADTDTRIANDRASGHSLDRLVRRPYKATTHGVGVMSLCRDCWNCFASVAMGEVHVKGRHKTIITLPTDKCPHCGADDPCGSPNEKAQRPGLTAGVERNETKGKSHE